MSKKVCLLSLLSLLSLCGTTEAQQPTTKSPLKSVGVISAFNIKPVAKPTTAATTLASVPVVARVAATAPATTTSKSNAPVITGGVQTIFRADQLTGNFAAKITASSEYQVSVIFPQKVQSIGVNAAKQDAVMTTIDQYDGRVVYIDVLTPGGTATLNFRMLTDADVHLEKTGKDATGKDFGGAAVTPGHDPLILKMIVELTNKNGGVLSYKVTPSLIAQTVPAPAPAPAPAKVTPPPAPAPRPVKAPPQTVWQGSNSNLYLTVKEAPGGADGQQNYTYEVKVTPQNGKSYFVDTSLTNLRLRNINVPTALTIQKAQTPVTAQKPATGTLGLKKSATASNLPRVLMFAVIEKDNASGATKRRYIGVLLK